MEGTPRASSTARAVVVPPGTHSLSSTGCPVRAKLRPQRSPQDQSLCTRSGAIAAPVLRQRAGDWFSWRWGMAGATGAPRSSTKGGRFNPCSTAQAITAGVTPAGRGGKAWGRSAAGPCQSNSASAAAVRRRESGVAPAAEMPSTAAVSVPASSNSTRVWGTAAAKR